MTVVVQNDNFEQVLGCEHDFSVKREIPKSELPPYAKPPIFDTYCSVCGQKQTLRDRLSLAAASEPPPPPYVPPSIPDALRLVPDPEPVPLDQIVVTLDVDHYGKRYDNNRRHHIKDKAIHIEGDLHRHEAMAAAAEEFVAKALGLRHSEDVKGPDRGYDLIMRSRRIQVKWTATHGNRLIASPKQTNASDYYVLVTGNDPTDFLVPGWATLRQLKSSIQDLGYGPTYCVEQSDLRPFDELLAIRREGL